jgi:hypothetical protein
MVAGGPFLKGRSRDLMAFVSALPDCMHVLPTLAKLEDKYAKEPFTVVSPYDQHLRRMTYTDFCILE